MNMIEMASWQLELRQGCFSVLVYLGTLTGDTRPGPLGDLFSKSVPNEFGGH